MEKTSWATVVSGCVKAPSSKSYAQRAIAAALLAEGESTLHDLSLSEDTEAAFDVAKQLGAEVIKLDAFSYLVKGAIGRRSQMLTLNVGESGLLTRMFIPISLLYSEEVTITGRGSLLTRPMENVVKPIEQLGIKVSYTDGCLPVVLNGVLWGRGEIEIDGSMSSQFLTGLLMSLPLVQDDITIRVKNLRSVPYIDITLEVLSDFGVEVRHNNYKEFFIRGGQRYNAHSYSVEGDWSGVSALLVAGAIAGVGEGVRVEGLNINSKQGDRAIVELLARVGAEIMTSDRVVSVRKGELKAFEYDVTHTPDLVPAMVTLAANCKGVSTIYGVDRLRYKESDRVAVLAAEFGKLGIEVDVRESDVIRVVGGEIKGAKVSSHNDHRIAMCLAVAGLNSSGEVVIESAEAVNKSYPQFWADFSKLRAIVRQPYVK